MVCKECQIKDTHIEKMRLDLIEIKKTNNKIRLLLNNMKNNLKQQTFFQSITNFFYSFFQSKKQKYKDF